LSTVANHHRWFLHALAVLYFTMGFVARFAWPPLIPAAAPDLGLSMSGAGAYMSAFYLGYVLFQIPGGLLGDRFGARLVIGFALLVEALGTFGTGMASDFSLGFACRLLTGLGAAAVYTCCVRYALSLFPPGEVGLAYGLMMMAPAGIGVLLPNLLMPWLNTLLSWRGAFQAISVVILLTGAAAFLAVRDTPGVSARGKSVFQGIRETLGEKRLLWLSAAWFWLLWFMVGFLSWSNTYIKELGFSLETGSRVMLVYGVAGLIASPLGGMLFQKVSSPVIFLQGIFLGLAACAWFFVQSVDLVILSGLAGIIGFLLGLAYPALPLLISMLAKKETVATASGVTACIFQLGAVAGPWVMGLSKDLSGSFTLAWVLLAGSGILGAISFIPLKKMRNSK